MTPTISFTIPLTDHDALNRVSLMLSGLANDATNEKPVQIIPASDQVETETVIDDENSTTVEETTTTEETTTSLADSGAAPELDKAGFPWDERIHGKAKKQTAKDGRWTKIKNLDKNQPGLFDTVIAELTAAGFGPAALAGSSATTTTTTTDNVVDINANKAPAPAPAPEQTAPAPAPEQTAPAPVADISYIASDGKEYTESALRLAGHTDETLATLQKVAPAAPVTTETATTEITFPELMAMITPAQAAGDITPADITAALAPHGLTSLPLLSAQPQLVPAVKQALFG